MSNVNLPVSSMPFLGTGGVVNKPWYQALQQIASRANKLTQDAGTATDLETDVTGVLPVESGGTGKASFNANQLIAGNGTDDLLNISPGSAGQVLISQGAGAVPDFSDLSYTDAFLIIIEAPTNRDYPFLDVPFAFTLNSVTTRSGAGTCTLTTKKNSTTVATSSVTTTKTKVTVTTGNSYAVNDDLVFTVSGTSSINMLQITAAFTRTIT
ncbi:MAG: hypothetical protein IPL32_18640 [Chloracidobacterium sp.]|nr:hypothetical protein [Chloracidobacterium sp.]